MKQKTLQFALEWSSRTQEFQVSRQPIPSMGCGNRESLVTNLPTRSRYDQVTVTRWTQRRPWRNVGGGRQQAGNVIRSMPDDILCTSRHSLYCILSVIGNQCNSCKAGVTWSPSFKSRTVHAAAGKTVYRGASVVPANPQEQHLENPV